MLKLEVLYYWGTRILKYNIIDVVAGEVLDFKRAATDDCFKCEPD